MIIKKYASRYIVILLLLACTSTSFAQSAGILRNTYIKTPIKADGELNEWGDSLQYYNPETKLLYAIGNDETNLYLAIQTADAQAIGKILSFGISFSVNKEGKKKVGPTITFPIVDKTAVRTIMQKNQEAKSRPDFNKLNQQIISKTYGIHVDAYKNILDGDISLNNEYGIAAAARIDDKNNFQYELVIPLEQLAIDLQSPGVLACNIQLNGLQRTELYRNAPRMRNYGGYGYGYYDYGDRNIYKRTISESADFWIKTTLVKP